MDKLIKNTPEIWIDLLPNKKTEQHKYNHGHAFVYGAASLTGATHLAASACARIGTGLVTVMAPENKGDMYRTFLPPHILVQDPLCDDTKKATAKLYGPGDLTVQPDYLSTTIPTVLDAAALHNLPEILSPNFVLTPHQGEFDKVFPNITGSKTKKAQNMAQILNCFIVLKGTETIIAGPQGQISVNTHASSWLATAGSGDVLAGMITGLLAQKMPVFEACCAAVWIHGDCALRFGNYLVASDLPNLIPDSLNDVLNAKSTAL